MRKFGLVLVRSWIVAALVAAVVTNPASAVPIPASGSLSFSIAPGGSVTLDTGDITGTTSNKQEGPLQLTTIGGNLGTNSGVTGVIPGAVVTFGPQPVPVPPLLVPTPVALTVTIGTLTFTFDLEETLSLVPTTTNSAGSFALTFDGTFVSDSSGTFSPLPQSASLSESCTQAAPPGSLVNCSNTISTPSAPTITTPEPASLALVGAALVAGFGLSRPRRRKAA
jgi:PEP-CTERM motif-containing protein